MRTQKILNLTQHDASAEQLVAGVVDLIDSDKIFVRNLLTVDSLEELSETPISIRCKEVACIAHYNGATHAMIGGAPAMMAPLEEALNELYITPVYSFSRRESIETTLPSGSVRKTAVFRHCGWWPYNGPVIV